MFIIAPGCRAVLIFSLPFFSPTRRKWTADETAASGELGETGGNRSQWGIETHVNGENFKGWREKRFKDPLARVAPGARSCFSWTKWLKMNKHHIHWLSVNTVCHVRSCSHIWSQNVLWKQVFPFSWAASVFPGALALVRALSEPERGVFGPNNNCDVYTCRCCNVTKNWFWMLKLHLNNRNIGNKKTDGSNAKVIPSVFRLVTVRRREVGVWARVCMCACARILMKKTLGCCLVGLISRGLQTTDDAQVSPSSPLIHLFIY